MQKIIAYLALSLLTLSLSCQKNKWGHDFSIDEKPIESFLESADIEERPFLKIKTSAFHHDFFFYGSFIPVLSSESGFSLRGRIIHFKPYVDRVIMLESTKGHSIANDKDSMIILAEFPVVRSDNDGVVIDFAKGMNSAFTTRNVHSQSSIQKDADTSEQFRAVALSASFVKSVKSEDNILSISQVAQWRNNKSELISAEFRYFFRDYLPSPTFKMKAFSQNRWVQYFSTPPLVEAPTTDQVAYITKWDLSKPIVFYISANTPDEYVQAITDGILFWNHIFKQDIIEVQMLPEGVSAPHPRFNIIQWVVWDNEASAYADMVVNHLTGETMQAQIYLHSGWVRQSSQKLRNQLTELLITEPKKIPITSIEEAPMPSMFDYDEPCFIALNNFAELSELTQEISINDISDETIKILTGDIIRAVIAHETGHVLGLRHNLASSTQGISLNERKELLRSYLQTGDGELLEKPFSRSIMDVFSAADDAIIGAQLRKLSASDYKSSQIQEIYKYDKQAIDFGYFNKPMPGDMAFCTDEDMEKFLDCARWDISDTSILFASSRLNNSLDQISITLADTFIRAIDPKRKGGPIKIQDVPLNTNGVMNILSQYTKDLFSWHFKNSRSIAVESKLPALGPHNFQQINQAKFKMIRDETAVYGVNKTFFDLLPPFNDFLDQQSSFLESFSAHFDKRLEEFGAGDFSIESKEAYKIAMEFFESLHALVIDQVLTVITKTQFDDPLFQEPVEHALGQVANEIVLGQKESTSLPIFRYELKTRDLAARLLNPSLGILSDWSLENIAKTGNGLKKIMSAVVNGQGTDLLTMSREKRQWLLDQNRIINTLTQIKGMSRPLFPLPTEKKPEKGNE